MRSPTAPVVLPPPGGAIVVPVGRARTVAQRPLQARGIGESFDRVLGQAPQHDALQVVGDVRH